MNERSTTKFNTDGPGTYPTPDSIGRYNIERRLGSGLHGVVYLATDPTQSDREVAIKLLTSGQTRSEFDTLIELGRKMGGLVNVLDQGQFKGRPFFVMEYFHRGSLRARLQELNRPITLDEARVLIGQLRDVLGQLHKSGHAHGDVKPDNLMLGTKAGVDEAPKLTLIRTDEQLVLCDYASVRNEGAETSLTANVWTRGYADPNLMVGPDGIPTAHGPTRTADIFAATALVAEAVSGARPRQLINQNDEAFTSKQWATMRPFQRVLRRGLNFDPAKRPQSMTKWHDELIACLDKRSPARYLAAASVLIIALAGANLVSNTLPAGNLNTSPTLAASPTTVEDLPDNEAPFTIAINSTSTTANNDISPAVESTVTPQPGQPNTALTTNAPEPNTTGSTTATTISPVTSRPSTTAEPEATTSNPPTISTLPPTTGTTTSTTAPPSSAIANPDPSQYPNPLTCTPATGSARTVFWFTKVDGATFGDGRNVYNCQTIRLDQPAASANVGATFHLVFERCWADRITVSDGSTSWTLQGNNGTCANPSSPDFAVAADGSTSITITATRSEGNFAYRVSSRRS